MFDNLFQLGGAAWALVPLAVTMVVFGVFVVGFDARAIRSLERGS